MLMFRLRRYFITLSVLAAAACLASLFLRPAHSQNRQPGQNSPPQDENVLRINTELVQIDVTVADKDGKLVRDLKREDFELYEDGKKQEISHFSIGTAARQATWLRPTAKTTNATAPVVARAPEVDAGRYLVLTVDDLHLAPGNLMLAKQALSRFIDQQMGSGDKVALVTTSGVLGLYQQFTTERDALKRAINRLSVRERQATSSADMPHITPYQAELIDQNDPEALELAVQELVRELNIRRDQAVPIAQGKARSIIAENTNVTVATLSTLENVVRGLRELPGRKVMVLLSDGFLLGGLRSGRHFDVRRITDAATRAGVVIYSLDVRGLIAVPATMDASQPGSIMGGALAGARSRIENSGVEAQRDGLHALARDTGGLPLFNNNDINLGLQRVLDDTETYYLLAFEPSVSYRDGRYRKLEIKLVNRPGLKIRTRSGYFSPDDKAAEKENRALAKAAEKDKEKAPEKLAKEQLARRDAQVSEALGALFSLSGLPVEIVASFINTAQDGSAVDIASHIEMRNMRFTPTGDRQRAILEVIGLVFDENGKVISNFSDRLEMNLKPAGLERLLKNGLTYRKQVKLAPGFHQVRLVVRQEESPQVGSASSWIEVPDLSKKQLTLSSIFFAAAGEELTATPAGQNAVESATLKDADRPTHIFRRFKSGDKFDFMVFAYNAKTDAKGATDLAVQSQVFSGNKLIFASPLRAIQPEPETGGGKTASPHVDPERIPYLARFSVEGFTPGTYELRLVVVDRTAKVSAKRAMRFTVE